MCVVVWALCIEPDQSGVAVELHGDMDADAAAALRLVLVQLIPHQRRREFWSICVR
jgi:hypothetical protein